jgi:cell division protein FtsQ
MTQPVGAEGPETGEGAADAEQAAVEATDPEPADTEAAPDEAEGPRRRARRERAERRAAEQRARAIEQARREARRRAKGRPSDEPKSLPRGAIRGLKMAILTVLVAAAAIGLGLVLYFTPVMSVRSIAVSGLDVVTREEVLDTAQVSLETPLLQVDTGRVADRVATIRRVAGVRVQRDYPSTLQITVVERIPLAVKDFADGPHLFDRDGVDFATAAPSSPLPYLDVDNPDPSDPPTRAALQVLIALRAEVAGQVGRIAAPSVSSITLTLNDGRVVLWGTTDRTAEKAEKLAALLTQPGRTYDVSSPDLPTVR